MFFLCLLVLGGTCRAAEPPVLPVGLDAYRMWAHWPDQRIGVRTYMRSTYDRRGGNEAADASHFLYQAADDFNVVLDVAGPGVLYFVRCNHWHGSPWHYEVDGVDHLVEESSTANPNHPVQNSIFLPAGLFPPPLAWTWSVTKGADLNWVPIPFERTFRLAYSRTHYGTGYFIYDLYDPSARLSRPIHSWDGKTPPAKDVLELIGRSGSDIAPRAGTPEGERLGIHQMNGGPISLGKGAAIRVAEISVRQPAMLRALKLAVPRDEAVAFGRTRLRVTWDGRAHPSIDAPVALFFGAGTLYNRDNRTYLVKAFPANIRFGAKAVHLACYFPMPFFRSARIELIGNGKSRVSGIRWSLRYDPLREPAADVGYFHATYRDHPHPAPGRDLVLLDTRKTEGGGDWSGSFVGTSWIFSHRAVLGTLEGDPRFFFDDSRTPQAQGTGTEEWGGGGDYWGGRNMTLPFAGHPVGAPSEKAARNNEDKIESAYRFLLADLFPFGKRALICLEHGGEDQSKEHYESVTYWYGVDRPTLIKTDTLKIGDPTSERAHQYVSPQASAPYRITSRYELGVDTLDGREIYPAETDVGRKTAGESRFDLKLDPANYGVLLRRKLDYSLPNQRADVYVAAPRTGQKRTPDWKFAGVWYLAGENTCVYSNPRGELGATQHRVETSNRRFRDDEFLIPRALTRGRSAIRIRIKFTPVKIPLFPGHPLAELGWSEIRYDAYCYGV